MKPYKLKHLPTGMYYQPHKHRGSNISKRGKIYQTATHGLSGFFKSSRKTFTIWVQEGSVAHKETKDILNYQETYHTNQLKAETSLKDWIIEEI